MQAFTAASWNTSNVATGTIRENYVTVTQCIYEQQR